MTTLELISVLVVTAALFGWVTARWTNLPLTIGIMLLTLGTSVALEATSNIFPVVHQMATRLVGQIDFEAVILHGMLSLLLFAGAFLLDLESLSKQKMVVGVLSVAGTVLSTLGTAALLWWLLRLIGLETGWIECLFFGALISPTDPIAVLDMLKRVGVPKYVQAQLAGESLFNDGVGAVLFLAVLDAARGQTPSLGHVVSFLLLKAGGGILLGVAAAWLASQLMRRVKSYQVDVLITFALGLAGYALADMVGVSAPLEAVVAGIALRRFDVSGRVRPGMIAHESIDRFWEVWDEAQNALLFVLLGLEVLAIPFDLNMVKSGSAAVITVMLVRTAVVGLLVLAMKLVRPRLKTSVTILSLGGLRGGLALALALAVPEAHGRSWILGTTYIVVVFSIVVQGGAMDLFLKRTKRRATLAEQ